MWKDFLSPESIQTIKKGMYYTELLQPGLRLIALNTAILWPWNFACLKTIDDPGDQFAWVRGVLSKAKENGEKVFLITHVPPGRGELTQGVQMSIKYNDAYADAFTGFYDIIVASFFGHVHADSFRIMSDASSESLGFLQGGMTPHGENPTMGFWSYKSEWPFTLMDRQTFGFNLTQANEIGQIKWEELYRYTEAYGVKDMSVESIKDLVERMKKDDNKMFDKWYSLLVPMMMDQMPTCKTIECKQYHMCVLQNVRVRDLERCLPASSQ